MALIIISIVEGCSVFSCVVISTGQLKTTQLSDVCERKIIIRTLEPITISVKKRFYI